MSFTFVMIKPDATKRDIEWQIISRFKAADLHVKAASFLDQLPRADAEFLYAEHSGRAHFKDLIDYTVSGPVVLLVLESLGNRTVVTARNVIGSSDPTKAEAGTIWHDLALNYRENSVHGSDSIEAAQRELKHFFPQFMAELKTSADGV